tara:strand:+ start:465 stop:596 length:132 start_codon:yes stop_codon:yes gene_type:complete
MLGGHQDCVFINLVKENGETKIESQAEFEKKQFGIAHLVDRES